MFPVITETQNDSQSILSSTDFYKELEGMIQSSFTQDLSLKMEESLELGQKLMYSSHGVMLFDAILIGHG